jgi:hypothetical protein
MLIAAPAWAGELRDFCPDRPGLGTPTCIVDRGRIVVETGIADWTRETGGTARKDSVSLGSTLVRYGVNGTLELQAGWDAYGIERIREAGSHDRGDGSGDLTFAFRQSLRNPDGSGFSVAVMPYVTAPVGSDAMSAGDWGGGVIVPVSFDLGNNVSLAFSPEIDVAVDGDGDGRHAAFGSVVGLGFNLSDAVSVAAEVALFRDDDPDDPTTQALAGLALAWQPQENLQLDVGVVLGLNADSPDTEVYGGIARRF